MKKHFLLLLLVSFLLLTSGLSVETPPGEAGNNLFVHSGFFKKYFITSYSSEIEGPAISVPARIIMPTPTHSPVHTPTPTATPDTLGCVFPFWDSTKTYLQFDRVHYRGRNWEAKWYAHTGEEPGQNSSRGVWKDLGTCTGDGEIPIPTPTATQSTPTSTPTILIVNK